MSGIDGGKAFPKRLDVVGNRVFCRENILKGRVENEDFNVSESGGDGHNGFGHAGPAIQQRLNGPHDVVAVPCEFCEGIYGYFASRPAGRREWRPLYT